MPGKNKKNNNNNKPNKNDNNDEPEPEMDEEPIENSNIVKITKTDSEYKKMMELFEYNKEEVFLTAVRPYVGKPVKDYKSPDSKIINQMNNFFDALHSNDVENIIKLANILNVRGKRFKTHPNILFFTGPRAKVGITFFWRVGNMVIPNDKETYSNPVHPLVLQSPHEGVDNATKSALTLFENTKARILIMNAVHPRASDQKPKCQSTRSISDSSHSSSTLFHKAHIKMSVLYPFAFFVQVHGMKKHKNMHVLIVNSYNSEFTKVRKSGPRLFADALPEFFSANECHDMSLCGTINSKKGVEFKRPTGCHNSNMQGHHLNGGNICSTGKRDTGRFMHVELDPTFRLNGSDKNLNNFSKAMNLTMENWNMYGDADSGIPREPLEDIEEEEENPEIIDDNSEHDDDEDDVFEDSETDFPEFDDLVIEDGTEDVLEGIDDPTSPWYNIDPECGGNCDDPESEPEIEVEVPFSDPEPVPDRVPIQIKNCGCTIS